MPSSTARRNGVPAEYSSPPKYPGHVSECASKCTSPTGPCRRATARSAGREDRVVAADADRKDGSVHQRRDGGLDAIHRRLHIAGHHACVAGIGDAQPFEHVDVTPVGIHRAEHDRHRPDRVRPETRPGAVGSAGVARQADDRRIERTLATRLRQAHERRQPAEARAVERIDGEKPAHRSVPSNLRPANRTSVMDTDWISSIWLQRSGARVERTPEQRAQNMVRIGSSGAGL